MQALNESLSLLSPHFCPMLARSLSLILAEYVHSVLVVLFYTAHAEL